MGRLWQKREMDDSEERIHVCSICMRRFKRTEHCLRHERSRMYTNFSSSREFPQLSAVVLRCSWFDIINLLSHLILIDTKVKPYNCRFCERSYGRKDLVVRHEKTLHEEDWIKAQMPSEESTAASDSLLSRQKRRLSTVSYSDEWKNALSAQRIPHPEEEHDVLSCVGTQTTAIPSSTGSGFDCMPYVPQINCNFTLPLKPGTEGTAESPRESSVPEMAISSIPQLANPCYVEGNYPPQQYNHQMPGESVEPCEDLNQYSVPVDPNLFETVNSKPQPPWRPDTPRCFEILDICPSVYGPLRSFDVPQENEEDWEETRNDGKWTFQESQVIGHPSDSHKSILQSPSNLIRPPISTVRLGETLSILFADLHLGFENHKTNGIISLHLLAQYLDQIFYYFNPLIHIFYVLTFNIKTAPSLLILAIGSIGASSFLTTTNPYRLGAIRTSILKISFQTTDTGLFIVQISMEIPIEFVLFSSFIILRSMSIRTFAERFSLGVFHGLLQVCMQMMAIQKVRISNEISSSEMPSIDRNSIL
ncbi:hypothetical protein PAAG_11991 [Paracoccidioides lutzii Pb01]|uniref:C2H2-type domain-containing protein n=1 Tax=Paracoccidioides lutzii (strain ATCC MYA-826 / Pb01) TaxID=502779 RepID=A0A0A2V4M7_PARBA|nr:hypothetical protein PAAG_11991 [Paracoccidioides lutzii Pb01]KGQ01312.1 hypothetical protein PAAG_11991 [Paracoccidioides lutzii Pb01]